MKIGFLGCGKMATALVHGVVQSAIFPKAAIFVSDCLPGAAEKLAAATGTTKAASNEELAQECDVVVLCVKPLDAIAALHSVQATASEKLVLSIVAGLTIATLQAAAGEAARIIRVMPNTPALIHQGAAAYALGPNATTDDASIAQRIFGAVGIASVVKEELLDVVTGLSGSGPAYVYLMIEALSDAGVLLGLPRELSLRLSAQTVAGAAGMVLKTERHPAVLKDEVTSPGGTTMAGLEVLETHAVRAALVAAVRAAAERAQELGAGK
jgi:pyrroline-5-carboxylate reductase